MQTATLSLKTLEDELNEMILEGNALEAFERFYGENVVMQEAEDSVFQGKDVNRDREKEFFSKITEFRGAELHDVAVGDDVTMSTWSYDYTHEDWGDVRYTQVAVRHWDGDKIVKERFFKSD